MKKTAKEKNKNSGAAAEKTAKPPTDDAAAPAVKLTTMERARLRVETSRRAANNKVVAQSPD